MYPSFFAMGVSGFILAIVIIMLVFNYDRPGFGLDDELSYRKYVILLLFSLGVGVHGLAHAYAEVNFDFNPLQGQWKYEKIRNKT